MSNQNEIINILKAELTLLSQNILRDIHNKDLKDLHKSARKLYEKISAVQHLTKLVETDKLLEMLSLDDNVEQNSNFSEQDKFDKTIENKEEKSFDEQDLIEDKFTDNKEKNPYKSVAEMKFVPKNESSFDFTGKKISIGLNDKISFIKHLFNGDAEMYEKVISNLNKSESYEKGLSYIYTEVKPKYNNWDGKEEYEFRLIQLFELKFS